MRRLLYHIIACCVAVLFFAACDKEFDVPGDSVVGDGNSIILDLSSGTLPVSRAVNTAAAGAEVKVDHIDVLIFDENGNKKHHERVGGSETGSGTIILTAKRSSFVAGARYWVYLIANSTAEVSVFAADDFDRTKLRSLTQEDRNIHMTGYPGTDVDAPEYFLMDGIAYLDGDTEPAVSAAVPVVLNNGNKSNDTKLKVTLRRAAAKLVIRIKKGQFVEFNNGPGTRAGYYLRNMPYSTSVMTGVGAEANLRTSDLTDNDYFKWTQDVEDGPYTLITVTAYTYAHTWENKSALENETRLIVNIPMYTILHDEQGNYIDESNQIVTDPVKVDRKNSYYQIPVCRGSSLERNTCYEVSLTLNVPGGTEPSEPVKLEPINYEVREWDEKTINIGGDQNRPTYLTVNEDEIEMRNISEDHTTLQFASSSEVDVEITDVYYYDKFGQKQNLSPQQQADVHISAEPDPGLTGKIDIKSDVPTNNAIRYIELRVTNTDNATPRTVTIAQYPLEYITNVPGWYSYRNDFGANGDDGKPTTYELLNGNNTYTSRTQITQRRVSCYYINNSWVYENRRFEYVINENVDAGYPFFCSKVSEGSNGTYAIYYFYWDESGRAGNYRYNVYHNETSSDDWIPEENNYGDKTFSTNPHMYYVRITASSGDYTLGKPHIDANGYTDSGADNAMLVSPSFMIASQLGTTSANATIEMAKQHCKLYVEVGEDGTIYNDWRLPTRAEIGIINKFQYQSDAIDEILSGKTYWCADENEVTVLDKDGNEKTSGNEKAVRCIRDAYDDKKTGN